MDTALPTLFASLLVKDGENILLGVFGDEKDEFCDGVVGRLVVLLADVFFPLFLFFAILDIKKHLLTENSVNI